MFSVTSLESTGSQVLRWADDRASDRMADEISDNPDRSATLK